jgi:hypothetical protein
MSFGVATDSNNPTVQAIQATGFVDQSVDMSAWGIPGLFFGIVGGNSFPLSTYVGQGLSVLQYNINSPYPQGANWTQGNGTLAIFVKYTYVEV